MPYYSEKVLNKMGFKFLGRNVKISDKASLYNVDQIEVGDNSRIDDFCVLSGKIKIGKHVHIAPLCLIAGGNEGVYMNDFSGLAYGGKIFSQSDDYTGQAMTNATVPVNYTKVKMAAVSIGRHVIIGAGSIIFPGVNIGEGCSVGAMALVNRSTESWGIYTGNPAKRVKERKKDLLVLEKQFLTDMPNDSI
jgi:acetyltransferase-like isoleucine patch superfamily enzyme